MHAFEGQSIDHGCGFQSIPAVECLDPFFNIEITPDGPEVRIRRSLRGGRGSIPH